MTAGIKSLREAARHGLVVRVECKCGNIGLYRARDLMKEFGGERDPRGLKFRCTSCRPKPVDVTLVEIDHDRPPKTPFMKPFRVKGKLAWMSERFR